MKHLLEAINRGILKGLNENNVELLADLADDIDGINMENKDINNKISTKNAALNVHIRKVANQLIKLLDIFDTTEFPTATTYSLSKEDKQFI
mgnify:CR=1 FL=1